MQVINCIKPNLEKKSKRNYVNRQVKASRNEHLGGKFEASEKNKVKMKKFEWKIEVFQIKNCNNGSQM